MNEYQRKLMDAPSWDTPLCPICGARANNRHHVVPRSAGGTDGPTVTLCGFGNADGCHGMVHNHTLHIRYNDGWEWLRTGVPVKDENLSKSTAWRKFRDFDV